MNAIDTKVLRMFLDMDRRARQMVDTAVVYAIGERGYPEEECDFREFASDIATRATAALLKMIYEDDAEIGRLRTERDRYKRLAEESLHLRPLAPMFLRDSDTRPKAGDAKQGSTRE